MNHCQDRETTSLQFIKKKCEHTPIKSSTIFILFIVFLAYGLFIAIGSLSGFPSLINSGKKMPYLSDKPVGEDAYYMLTVAWNFADGKGLVYNDNEPTTGFQPLVTLIYSGFAGILQFLGGNKWTFIRLIFIFGLITHLIFAHLVGKIACELIGNSEHLRKPAYLLAALAATFNFSLFRVFTYGLETGVYLVLIALCIKETLKYHTISNWNMRLSVRLGFIVALTILARIDFGIIVFIFTLLFLFSRRIKLIHAVSAGVTAFFVVSPWFLWVKLVSGNWLPSSGNAQAELISANSVGPRFLSMVTSFLDHMTPWAYEANRKILILAGLLSLIIFFYWLLRKKTFHILLVLGGKLRVMVFWATGMFFVSIIYVIFFWARHFYGRYSAFFLTIIIPILAILTAKRIESSCKLIKRSVFFILPLCFFITSYFSLHTGHVGNNLTIAAGFIQKEFSPPLKVGSFQSGVIGYFNPNVVNLDGKVNSHALSYLKENEISRYIDQVGIDVLVDWPSYIFNNIEKNYLDENWRLYDKQILPDAILCYIRKKEPVNVKDF